MSSPGLRTSLRILTELGQSKGSLSFSVLKEKTETSNATLNRLLMVLMEEGWVIKKERGGYACGPKFRTSADFVVRNHRVPQFLKNAVERIAEETGQSACFIMWEDTYFVIRHKRDMPESYFYMPVGKPNRRPLVNGLGKLLLAHQPTPTLERVLSLRKEGTIDRNAITADLDQLREQGFCISDDNAFRIGIPVSEDGKITGVIGISTAERGIPDSTQKDWLNTIRMHVGS